MPVEVVMIDCSPTKEAEEEKKKKNRPPRFEWTVEQPLESRWDLQRASATAYNLQLFDLYLRAQS